MHQLMTPNADISNRTSPLRGPSGHSFAQPHFDHVPRERNAELGHFLRLHRKRLSPVDVGLKPGNRRRTIGLRREEVAELAGISTDWYTWLEQGRNINPSAKVLDSIAHALRLKPDQHAYLMELVRTSPTAQPTEQASTSVKLLLRNYGGPAYVIGRSWNLLAWNGAAREFFVDFDSSPELDRNLLWYLFLDERMRRLLVDWKGHARSMLAQFRPNVARYPQDPAVARTLSVLHQRSVEFRSWWNEYNLECTIAGTMSLHHATRGRIQLDYVSFQPEDAPDTRLVIYTHDV